MRCQSAIEASTSGIFAYEYLDERGIEVHLAHPTLVKPFAKDGLSTRELCPRGGDKRSKNNREA